MRRAGAVRGEGHDVTRLIIAAEQRGHERRGARDHRGTERPGIATDQLGVQSRPGGITVAFVTVSAGQARRAARNDQRTDRHAAGFERDGEVGPVIAKQAGELHGRGLAAHEHDRDIALRRPIPDGDALVAQRLSHAMSRTPVGEVDRLDPRVRRPRRFVDQVSIDPGEKLPGFGPRRAECVRDHIERGPSEAGAHATEQEFHPVGARGHRHIAVHAQLQGVRVAPEQRERGIQTGQ
ncbi:MAG: hypothetical protein P0Y60_08050 [Candidatus Microbacterium colombiense]|nr:MAG: hypothetical protein P0Y60_08050 [Microbacterium sp.]